MRESPSPSPRTAGRLAERFSAPAGDLLALPAGYALNEYRIERVLGWGGFGITYLAHDTHLDCPVAIKEYLPRAVAGRGPEQSVCPHSEATAQPFEWGLQRFLLESGRWPASTMRASCGCCAISAPTTPPTWSWSTKPASLSTPGWRADCRSTTRRCCVSCGRCWTDSRPSTTRASCTATSSRATSTSVPTARRCCSISAPPAVSACRGQEQMLTAVVTPGFAPAEQY
jgi:hypothetical protein